jgi:hypothetical protein
VWGDVGRQAVTNFDLAGQRTKAGHKVMNWAPKSQDQVSQYRGVFWRADLHKWQPRIKSNGVRQYLGLFEDDREVRAPLGTLRRKILGRSRLITGIVVLL